MAKNDTVNRAPLIRFPGFEDFWEEKSLGEVCDSILVGFPFKGQDITDNASGHPILRAYSIGEGIIRHGKDYDKYYPGDTKSLERYKVNTGDIVISMDGSVGRNIALISDDENGYLLIQRVARLRVTQYPVQLIYQQIISQRFKDYAAGEKVGAVIAHISQKQIESFPVFVPKTRLEQNKVASIMTETDRMISAQEQKVESLKAHKKGLMQQLFPQSGETIPRLRFPGFKGEWEERTLGEIGDTFSGLTGKSKEDFENGNSKFITFMNVLKNIRIDTSILGTVNVGDRERQNTVENGDMLFNTSSETPEEVGFCSVYDSDIQENVYLNSFCFGYRFKEKTNYYPLFLAYYIRSVYGRSLMNRLAQGITRFNLSKEYFNKAIIPFPTFNEQQKIAECLSSLDQIISVREKELEAIKVHKKGLMQQLFPQPVK